MTKFLFIFAMILVAMGVGLPFLGIHDLPLWQVACGAFIPTAAIYYISGGNNAV